MMKNFSRITAVTVSAVVVAAALAFAAPAGARDTYSPTLMPRVGSAARIAASSVATFRPGAAAKRPTRIVARTTTTRTTRTTATSAASSTSATTGTSDAARAKAILAGLIAKYPILKGTTVEMGDARGYQAIAYYRSGRIVISRSHTSSLSRILNHEVWHVIDYRDNGRIDWGENIPRG